jgi:hypothetical protein
MNAPYLFPNESTKTGTSNTSTGQQNDVITKSSRGYELLKTVYDEYRSKGLIAADFPVKTLREVLTIADTLDTLLEKQIFDQVVDMRLFAAMKEFGENIDEFEKSIRGWAKEHLETNPVPSMIEPNGVQYYYVKEKDKKTESIAKKYIVTI